MSSPSDTSKLIAAAASAALTPLGCLRSGKSRIWRCDKAFWAIHIEFQPSSWGSGSYLNVGPEWFWRETPGPSGMNRPVDFIAFESPEQFRPLAEGMAAAAAHEALSLADRFKSITDISSWLLSARLREGWPAFDAAVACALAGNLATAHAQFLRIQDWPADYDWQLRLKKRSAALAALLDRVEDFHEALLHTILARRKDLGWTEDRQRVIAALAGRALP